MKNETLEENKLKKKEREEVNSELGLVFTCRGRRCLGERTGCLWGWGFGKGVSWIFPRSQKKVKTRVGVKRQRARTQRRKWVNWDLCVFSVTRRWRNAFFRDSEKEQMALDIERKGVIFWQRESGSSSEKTGGTGGTTKKGCCGKLGIKKEDEKN